MKAIDKKLEIEKFLADLAQELSKQEERWFNEEEGGEPHVEMVLKVLRERIGPILESGWHAASKDRQ